MEMCEHRVAIGKGCWLCPPKIQEKKEKAPMDSVEYHLLDAKIGVCRERLDELDDMLSGFMRIIAQIRSIEAKGNEAIDLFIRKAHDLKRVDAKRDDVINSLCQKISHIEKNLNKEG